LCNFLSGQYIIATSITQEKKKDYYIIRLYWMKIRQKLYQMSRYLVDFNIGTFLPYLCQKCSSFYQIVYDSILNCPYIQEESQKKSNFNGKNHTLPGT
jgi:competence CoiA-like predicted nuclease